MKAYLILDNGFMVSGTLFGHPQNIIGELSINSNGSFSLYSEETTHTCILSESSASLKQGDCVFFSKDIEIASAMLTKTVPTYAKLVIDSLPAEYHLYDVKTYIPSMNTPYKADLQKGAA